MARLGEPVLRLMLLLGLERVRVELEHLQVWVEDVHQEDGGKACRQEQGVSRQAREQSVIRIAAQDRRWPVGACGRGGTSFLELALSGVGRLLRLGSKIGRGKGSRVYALAGAQ